MTKKTIQDQLLFLIKNKGCLGYYCNRCFYSDLHEEDIVCRIVISTGDSHISVLAEHNKRVLETAIKDYTKYNLDKKELLKVLL